MVHSLVEAYGLLKSKDITVISPRKATTKELCLYHSRDYIDFLRAAEDCHEAVDDEDDGDHGEGSYEDKLEEYGLVYDCRVFEKLRDYAEYVAGSTIQAASVLTDDSFDVAIHWDGGRHHAMKDHASGFCYINDIVLGIMTLQKEFKRVVYIDLDVHHGDGVEKAFQYSDKVLTISLHHFAKGFFPGTGDGDRHKSPQKTKAVVNLPLQSGLTGERLFHIFESLVDPVVASFGPAAVVLQCGVDGLAHDPAGKWNVSIRGFGDCVKKVLSWKKPTLLLGGGGYKNTSAARCYAYLTSLVIGKNISDDIPENPYFEQYGPEFTLHIDTSRKPDKNTDEYIKVVSDLVKQQSESF
ncbi:Histone deacetylase 8 [Actinomortierella ambigua]|uniref:Histone deacetylase 8 n=1 Tax=Actinomortierella ambigua TaxID=1343610 RepID=A0A9P6U075_9FUNG|nr:Histone deacetylase 8 [Actinomortierella ambigua]